MKNKLLKIKKEIINNIPLFCIITAMIILVFSKFIFTGIDKFKIINDQVFQFNAFYEEWLRLLKDFFKTGEMPYYSWYSFLGQDFLTNKIYYCTYDFLLPIVFVLYVVLKKNIITCLFVEVVLLIYIAAFSAKYLFKKFINNEKILILLSTIYAFSGTAILFVCNYMWLRYYALLPLLFLSIEHYLKKRKTTFFSLMVFILFLQNYYLFFPTSLFLIGYYIASYSQKKKDSLINILKSAIPLIIGYLIGLLLAGIALIPTIFGFILNSTRLGSAEFSLTNGFRSITGLLFNTIVPPLNIMYGFPNIFNISNYSINYYSTYASVLMIIILSSIRVLFKDNKTKSFTICLLIYFVILIINPLNSIMHAFSDISYRWTFLLNIIELILLGISIENNLLDSKIIKRSVIYILFIATMLVVSLILLGDGFKTYQAHLLSFGIYSLLGILCAILLHFKKFNILLAVVVLELSFSNLYILNNYSSPFFYYEESINKEYVDYYLNNDENKLVRIYIDPNNLMPGGDINLNNSLHYGYLSTTAYDSTTDTHLNKFIEYTNGSPYRNVYNINDIHLLKLLGVKYIGVYDESELPAYEDGYEYAFNLNSLMMYQLNDYNSIAHTFSSFVKESEFNKNNDFDWNNTLIIKDEDYDLIKDIKPTNKVQFIVEEKTNNGMNGSLNTESKTVLFTSLPYSNNWKVKDNGKNLETIEVDGGFLGIILEAGEHHLSYYYVSSYFIKGVYCSCAGVILLMTKYIYDKLKYKQIKRNYNEQV